MTFFFYTFTYAALCLKTEILFDKIFYGFPTFWLFGKYEKHIYIGLNSNMKRKILNAMTKKNEMFERKYHKVFRFDLNQSFSSTK